MPETNAPFLPRQELLSFEEIVRLARLFAERFGIREVRITGGEPLVRKDVTKLIQLLNQIDQIEDIALTTNGILLSPMATDLKKAGLDRINVSLDTLDKSTFQKVTRRSGLERVIQGIDSAIEAGFNSVKINALAIRGVTEQEVIRLVDFASQRGCLLRFIEFMPLDADQSWNRQDVFSGDQILDLLESHYGDITCVDRKDPSQPAETFQLPNGDTVGIIRSVTQPFCEACNRIRLTADGSLRNCLFAQQETSLRDLMRKDASDEDIAQAVIACVQAKKKSHGIDHHEFQPPDRPMYSIGG